MRLADLAAKAGHRLVTPLLGYPGAKLTNSSLKQNEFNPVLHCESLTRLVERFRPDVVFLMMDLSLEAGALGLPVRFPLFESPTVEEHPVASVDDLEPFRVLDPLDDVRIRGFVRTMELMAERIDIPKGGYVVGPFTLAGLLMGASELAMATVTDPELVHAVVRFSAGVCRRYALALADAGADIIAVLEPTATFLSPRSFTSFCGDYVKEILDGMKPIMALHICGNTTHLIREMCATGAEGLSLDSPVNLATVAPIVDPGVVLVGNIDPVGVMVQQTPEGVEQEVRRLLDSMAPYPNFILSTGCDLPYETPLENIDAFMKEGRR
ncbi:MAG: uroporphyrinogen decarboxylase family protein [Firmicutes bacterium]|jgi:uroporphyrinogen decarboxylase|nr:uroporphyrinogen decarboxylase family protein [Bacillota bacterium]